MGRLRKSLPLIVICLFFLISPFHLWANTFEFLQNPPILLARHVSSSTPQDTIIPPPADNNTFEESIDSSNQTNSINHTLGFISPDYTELPVMIDEVDLNDFCLNEESISSRVELRLLQHGITPMAEIDNNAFPYLMISINLQENTFIMQVELNRKKIRVVDSNSEEVNDNVWKKQVMGFHYDDLDVIFDSLDYLLAEFLTEYLTVNQTALYKKSLH